MSRKSGSLAVHVTDYTELPAWERAWRAMPWVDRETASISITRVLALYFAWIDGTTIIEKGATWAAFWLALAVLAAAFGKSTFGFLLTRVQMQGTFTSTEQSTHIVSEETKRQITERRDGDGHEATP